MPHILSEENREIQEMAREFAEAKIRPVSKEYDLKGETPLSVYKEAAAGIYVPVYSGRVWRSRTWHICQYSCS